jgi:hypothetical protein
VNTKKQEGYPASLTVEVRLLREVRAQHGRSLSHESHDVASYPLSYRKCKIRTKCVFHPMHEPMNKDLVKSNAQVYQKYKYFTSGNSIASTPGKKGHERYQVIWTALGPFMCLAPRDDESGAITAARMPNISAFIAHILRQGQASGRHSRRINK